MFGLARTRTSLAGLVLALCAAVWSRHAAAFAPSRGASTHRQCQHLFSTKEESSMLVVEGKNLELTEALLAHVEKRIGGPLQKLAASSSSTEKMCDVILSVSKNPKVKNSDQVEIVTNLKGTTFVCTHASPDMYNSIDQAAHALQRKLVKYKERRQDGWHGGAAMGDDLLAALQAMEEEDTAAADADEDEFFVDPEAPVITRVKSFDLEKPISVEEAVFALDYVDHDFYVFKNEATDNLTVVYKRHGGGVGLIEP